MLYDDHTAAQTYELYGPQNYSTAEIAELVDREIFKKRRHINVPKRLLKPAAGLLNRFLWWDIMSADEIEREFQDQVIDPSAKTFKDLGIEPGDIASFTYHYLVSSARLPNHSDVGFADSCCSKDTVAQARTICRRRQKRKRRRIERCAGNGPRNLFPNKTIEITHPVELSTSKLIQLIDR